MNAGAWRRISLEASVILAVGIALGLAANAVSRRGIALRRNYFAIAPAAAGPASPLPAALAGLAARGVAVITPERAAALFHAPAHAEGRIAFVDARDDAHYAAGHVPGAFQFDHYRMEQHVAEVLGACQIAERVIVYCNGGDCEDSALAAGDLLDLGVPPAKVVVYAAGFSEWQAQHLPIETGARGSGQVPGR